MTTVLKKAREVDGAPVVAANTWPLEQSVVRCGEGDDVANGVVGGGVEYHMQNATGDSEVTSDSQFMHPIRLGGGNIRWENCEYLDYASMKVCAPATVGTENVGSGEYAKLDLGGGASLYVAPGTPGAGANDWDIDLTEKLNGNVNFTKAVPVPAVLGNGFFTTTDGTALAYTPGTGTHNLFDFTLDLNMFVRKMWLIGSGRESLTVGDNIPAVVLPQWHSVVTLHREAGTGSDRTIVWEMLISRMYTV